MSKVYMNARWGVSTAAALQAKNDVSHTTVLQAQEYLVDQAYYMKLAKDVLKEWTVRSKTTGIFAFVMKSDFESLSDEEIEKLILFFIDEYVDQFYSQLRDKYPTSEGVTNG